MVLFSLIAYGTVGLVRAIQSAVERDEMKKEDNVNEREIERWVVQASLIAISVKVMRKSLPDGQVIYQSLDSNVMPSVVEHFKHPHELKQVSSEETFVCNGCGEIGEGKRYCCLHQDCKTRKFQLHMCCSLPPTVLSSQSPSLLLSTNQFQPTMFQSTAHKEHQVKEVYKNAKFKCDRCKTNGNGIRYHCDSCNIDFHQICAEHPYKVLSFMHPQHELVLRTKPMFDACALCQVKGDSNTRLYGCEDCGFWVHPTCIQWPQYLLHSLHPIHPLQLKYMSSSQKKLCDEANCEKKCKKWRYTCESCDVHFHLNCLLTKSMKGDASISGKLELLKISVSGIHAIKDILELTLN